jgi:hypothetical protein
MTGKSLSDLLVLLEDLLVLLEVTTLDIELNSRLLQ